VECGARAASPDKIGSSCPSGIDTDQRSRAGKLMIHVLAAVAEFERDLISERTLAGLAEYQRAFAAGKVGTVRHSRSGKNLRPGRPARVFRRDEAARLRESGMSWRAIARQLDIPQSTLRKHLASA
jgi:DNA invertase Pin-like site-specific DNA recombinase